MSEPTEVTVPQVNDNLVLIVGKATSGKSTSLRNLRDPKGVLYLNCEAGKKLPFKNEFAQVTITDPYQVYDLFNNAIAKPDRFHTIIIDSITYLMDMYESVHVLTAADTRAAWGDFQQFFKVLMQQYVPLYKGNVIMTAHTTDTINADSIRETFVPVKGALKNNGIESYFSLVVAAKKMNTNDLTKYSNDLLTITDKEKMLRYKHVIQTQITADTVNERLRAPIDLFSDDEAYIDGDIQLVLDRLAQFY